MADENVKKLADELKKYNRICYYPSSGRDLSDLDYFGSGRLLWNERVESSCRVSGQTAQSCDLPDLFEKSLKTSIFQSLSIFTWNSKKAKT